MTVLTDNGDSTVGYDTAVVAEQMVQVEPVEKIARDAFGGMIGPRARLLHPEMDRR